MNLLNSTLQKNVILTFLLSFLFVISSFSQFTTDEITYGNRIDLENSNSWAVGAGISNFIMHGDLRSIGSGDDTNYLNFGGMVYVDKMFNPLLGLEFKASFHKISGGSQYFSNTSSYDIAYANAVVNQDNLYFEGRAYGAELNLIFSFTNLYQTTATKWHAAGYIGVGYHQYNSALFERFAGGADVKIVDFGLNPARNSKNEASSIYLSAQFGLKRRISKRVDLEFRTGMYFNYEDHLDAAISNKQDWETYFVTSVGVAVKLGKKKVFTIWGDENKGQSGDAFKIIDTDKDGVMDQLDIEPNTPAGVMVYGNGKAVDSDKDGLPDYKDKCPLEYGPISNEGCPLNVDSDGDGIMDGKDLCPNTKGPQENRGCPKQESAKPENVTQQIALLATSIYFDTNSDRIKNISFANIDKIVGLMKKIPTVKFVIEGHTDDRNSDRYNLYLSQRRAASVRKYMVKQGIPADRLQSKGYGESRPKFSNSNAGGRQLNRRVEIKPVDSFD